MGAKEGNCAAWHFLHKDVLWCRVAGDKPPGGRAGKGGKGGGKEEEEEEDEGEEEEEEEDEEKKEEGGRSGKGGSEGGEGKEKRMKACVNKTAEDECAFEGKDGDAKEGTCAAWHFLHKDILWCRAAGDKPPGGR